MSNVLRIAGFSVLLVCGLAAKGALAADTLVLCDTATSELSGESQAAGATKCIDVQSWSWGSEAPSSLGSGGPVAGKPQLSDFTLQKPIDTSTTTFFKFLTKGTPFQGVLQFKIFGPCNTACQTPTPYFTIDLSGSFVTKQSVGGDADGRPNESISLTYKNIKVCYRQTDSSGMLAMPVCTSFDRSTGIVSGAQQ